MIKKEIYMEDILTELYAEEHPNAKSKITPEEYDRRKEGWRKDRQKKTFNKILKGLNFDNSLSDRLRGEYQKYCFTERSAPFIKKILSKNYRNRILNQIDPEKKNELTEEEIIKIVHGFYTLYLDAGYLESDTKIYMKQAMDILNYEQCIESIKESRKHLDYLLSLNIQGGLGGEDRN